MDCYVDEATKASHVDNINRKYNHKSTEYEGEQICPRCGSKLILRIAKKGDNAGNQFLGCSGFPKCRYIKNV